jgi:nicotinamide-nucleotide amidase
MKATIVTIGDEILIGQIVDTNSAFIAKSLDRIGVEINEMISISDDSHIVDTFENFKIPWIWLLSGGLGPTKDDVTKRRSVTILRTS